MTKIQVPKEVFETYILPGLRAQHKTREALTKAISAFVDEHEIVDADGNAVQVEAIHLMTKSGDMDQEPKEAGAAESAPVKTRKPVLTDDDRDAVIREAVRTEVAKHIKAHGSSRPYVTVDEPEQLKHKNAGYKSLGEFCLDVVNACSPSGESSPKLKTWHQKATVVNTLVGSEGGFLIPEGFSTQLLEKTYLSSEILNRTQKIPITQGNTLPIPAIMETSRVDGSRQGGIRAYWQGENRQLTESDVDFGQVKLEAKKLTGYIKVTGEMLKFSPISIEPILARLFERELDFKFTDAIVEGTGSGQPLGITAAPCLVSVAKDTGQAAATVSYQNLVRMRARMYPPLRADSVWLVNTDLLPQLYQVDIKVGTGGSVAFMPAGGLSASPYETLFGRPIIECESCSTLGTVGDIIYCAFSEYLWATVPGAETMASSIHLNFDYDRTCFRFIMYADGQPWWKAALTPFKGSNTQSPFIALATRS